VGGDTENAGQLNYAGVWLAERYLLKDLRAQGGLCAVYRGEDTVLRRPVAVKIVPARWDAAYRTALQATATLAHPAAITPYDAIEQDGQLFLAQEYLVAQPLGAYLREGAPIRRALDLVAQVARALAYAHHRDILHGDLTPAAILVDKRATARVNNFGLPPDDAYFDALALAVARSEQASSLSAPYSVAPHAEDAFYPDDAPTLAAQRPGADTLGPWGRGESVGDVWAAGALLWLLVTVPVIDDANGAMGVATNEPGLAGPRAFRPETPQELRALARRCILPGHPQRIADADTLVIALEDLAHALEVERPQVAAPTPRALVAARAAARREAERARREALAGLQATWSPDAPTDPLPYQAFDAGATRAATDFAASNVGVGEVRGGVGGYAMPAPPRTSSMPAPTGQPLRLPSRSIPPTDAYPAADGRRHSSFSAPTAPERAAWGAAAHDGSSRGGLLSGAVDMGGPTARGRAFAETADSPYAPYRPYAGNMNGADAAPGGRRGLGLAAWLLIGLLVFIAFFVVGYLLPPLTTLFH